MNDLVILHLSDLHIDNGGRTYSKLHSDLLKDIKTQMCHIPDAHLVIVVTGDILNKGKKDALSNAKSFFKKLYEITCDKVKAIYIVPGNHDKKRTHSNTILVPAYRGLLNFSYEKLFDNTFQEYLWPLQSETYDESGYTELLQYIYNDLFKMPLIEKIAKKTFGVHVLDIDNKKYCFILLNTAWSCIDEFDNRKLILGEFQLNEIEEQLRNTIEDYDTDPAALTFAMGHHPIECLYGTEQDALFSRMVSYNNLCANIYLCGHTHDRKVINWSNNRHAMHTLMTGFGWPEEPSDHVHEHYYSIYKFNIELNSMDIYVRRTNDGSNFIPDLSIYTGSKAHDSDKLVRPIRFEETQGAIMLSAAEPSLSKTIYASSDFLKFTKTYQDSLHEILINSLDIIEAYKNEFYECLAPDNSNSNQTVSDIDALLLEYLNDSDIFSTLSDERQKILKTMMEKNAPLIYENFQSFIQRLCQQFHRSLVEEVDTGQIVRFHFRYLSDKNTTTYSTLCSSFSIDDDTDEDTNQPSDIRYGDLLEAAFKCTTSGTMIYSINKEICKNKLKDKWKDFITVIPKFEENIYSRKVNQKTTRRYPYITFGVTINSIEHEMLLQCMDFYGIDNFIGSLLYKYVSIFMLDIDKFLTWLKREDLQGAQ